MTSPQESHDRINTFLLRLRSEAELQQAMKPVTTAAGVATVAAGAGFDLSPAELVKDFAQRLLEAGDERAVLLFDNCGWDHGELAWVLKTWDQIGS
ncbi:MAG: Nif11 family protein [Cyanobium sp.]